MWIRVIGTIAAYDTDYDTNNVLTVIDDNYP
jgi:hypothetical protein